MDDRGWAHAVIAVAKDRGWGWGGGRQTRATAALAAGLMKEEETGWQVQVLGSFQEMSLRKGEQSDKYSRTSGTLNTNSRFVICQRAFN